MYELIATVITTLDGMVWMTDFGTDGGTTVHGTMMIDGEFGENIGETDDGI
jgi:hypothetical protein